MNISTPLFVPYFKPVIQYQPIQLNNNFPSYLINKPEKNHIKFFIYYKNLTGLFNREIIKYLPDTFFTIDKLKDFIITNTKVDKKLIKIYPHPDVQKNVSIYLQNNELINTAFVVNLMNSGCDFFIVEIN
jgi:hypothetical protein